MSIRNWLVKKLTPMDEKEQKIEVTEMQEIYRAACSATGPGGPPQVIAAYMRACATLRLANEVASIRKLLESGEGAVTVGMEGTLAITVADK